MNKSFKLLSILSFSLVTLLTGCGSAFDKCVEAKQDEFKKAYPNENYEKLVREREIHERECQNLR
jgi:cell division protein FtsB